MDSMETHSRRLHIAAKSHSRSCCPKIALKSTLNVAMHSRKLQGVATRRLWGCWFTMVRPTPLNSHVTCIYEDDDNSENQIPGINTIYRT